MNKRPPKLEFGHIRTGSQVLKNEQAAMWDHLDKKDYRIYYKEAEYASVGRI